MQWFYVKDVEVNFPGLSGTEPIYQNIPRPRMYMKNIEGLFRRLGNSVSYL
jgi:hypothetical protein